MSRVRGMLSHFSRVRLATTLWTAAHQAPLSMGFSRQESFSGFPVPSPGDLPDAGTEPHLLSLLRWQAGAFTASATTLEAPISRLGANKHRLPGCQGLGSQRSFLEPGSSSPWL